MLKYFLIVLLSCAIVFVLFSCSSKKKSTVTAADQPVQVPAGVNPEAYFGSLYVDGCAQRMKGNLQEAVRLFGECLRLQPANPAVHYELGTVHKLLGNNQLAVSHAKFCAEKDPANEWYQLLLIDAYRGAGDYDHAIRVRESLVKRFPERSDFREDLGIDYAMTGQYEKSFRIYEQLEKEYGVNEQLTMNKVKLLRSQGRHGDVETELLRLSESDPGEVQYLAYLAEFYVEMRQMEKARSIYDRILAVDPANPMVHLALHDYYRERRDTAKAYEHLRAAFLNPDLDIDTKAGITGSFFRKAEENDAHALKRGTELASLMLQVHPKAAESNALYADFLMLKGDLEKAAGYYYTAAIAEKKDGRVWENLLHIENELRLYDSVEKHSRMALEMYPNLPRIYLYNGMANMQKGRPAEASRVLRDGLDFAAGNKALRLDLLRLLGDAYHQLRDHTRSDEAFEEALKIDPDNAYVLNNYAYYLSLRNHNLEHAATLSRHSLDLDRDNKNYMDTYGWILYQQGKYADAVEWLSKAAGGTGSPVIHEHYGDALYRLGKTSEALKWWNSARDRGGENETLLRKIRDKKIYDQ